MSVRTRQSENAISAAVCPVVEALEARQMFSVGFEGGVVDITGTSSDDAIDVGIFYERQNGADVAVATVSVNGRRQTFWDVTGVRVDARGGDDTVNVTSRNVPVGMDAVATTLLGGAGRDRIVGGLTSDLIDGGAGDDTLGSGRGGRDDRCAGTGPAAGNYVYDHRAAGGRDLNDAERPIDGHAPLTSVIENGILVITGSDGDDSILLYALAGRIHVSFLDGPMSGTNLAGAPLTVRGVRVVGGDGDDRIAVLGGTWDGARTPMTLVGGAGDDQIIGGDGNDSIASGAGHDLIDAGGGTNVTDASADDRVGGAAGAAVMDGDTLRIEGGAFDDRVSVVTLGDTGGVEVSINGTSRRFANVRHITVDCGAGNDLFTVDADASMIQLASPPMTVLGGDGDDLLLGGSGVNRVDGGAGNDTIGGGGGADTLLGGDGDDTLYRVAAGGVQLGGAGENLIFAADGSTATAGDDGAGSVEAQDAAAYVPSAEHNPENHGTDDDLPPIVYGRRPRRPGHASASAAAVDRAGGVDAPVTATPPSWQALAAGRSMFATSVTRPWDA